MCEKALNCFNARVQGFPSLDLGDGVERDPCCLRDFLDLREAAGVEVREKCVEDRGHAEYLTVCGRFRQHIFYRNR